MDRFDRHVRLTELEQIGFEFSTLPTQWYDHYHELIEYCSEQGHVRLTLQENSPLYSWAQRQRERRKGIGKSAKLSDAKIRLLDDIGFEWESENNEALWMEHYNELVAFRRENAHLGVKSDTSLLWLDGQSTVSSRFTLRGANKIIG